MSPSTSTTVYNHVPNNAASCQNTVVKVEQPLDKSFSLAAASSNKPNEHHRRISKKWKAFVKFMKRRDRKRRNIDTDMKDEYPSASSTMDVGCNDFSNTTTSGDARHHHHLQHHQHHSESTDDSALAEMLALEQEVLQSRNNVVNRPPSNDTAEVLCFDEKLVYDFVWQYHAAFAAALESGSSSNTSTACSSWTSFWWGNHTPDFLFIRPSGNPLDLQGTMNQFSRGEITNYEEDVIMVDSIKLLGAKNSVAVIVYRSETRFLFQGNQVEDTRTNTIVLIWHDGRPKITSLQRSMGKDINASG